MYIKKKSRKRRTYRKAIIQEVEPMWKGKRWRSKMRKKRTAQKKLQKSQVKKKTDMTQLMQKVLRGNRASLRRLGEKE